MSIAHACVCVCVCVCACVRVCVCVCVCACQCAHVVSPFSSRFLLAMFLSLCVANSFVFFFAALIPNPITGNTVVMSLTAFFFLFSGYFISQ